MIDIEKLVVDSINLEAEEAAFLSLNILPLLINAKKFGERFNIDYFLNYLEIKVTKKKATILIPSFSREFVEKNSYNRATTKCRTGYIPNQCLNRDGWYRTAHPIISYVAYGVRAHEFGQYKCYSAFGKDSILEKLLAYSPAQHFVGVEPEDAYTYLHYCEQKLGAPYRYSKLFTGNYVDYDGSSTIRSYEMYVKKDKNYIFDFKKGFINIFYECDRKIFRTKKIYVHDNLKNIENLINEQK